MKDLFQGVKKFQKEEFLKKQRLFKELKNGQSPHSFFIGCSDSRIVPDLFTSSDPGELFVVRNIANIIPPYSQIEGTYKCTASALEYAVLYLEVENIVVCGHSDCGGLKALLYPKEKLEKLPNVVHWLDIVKDKLDLSKTREEIEKANILLQIKNILTYPFVVEKIKEGKLHIYGWYYIFETGEVYNYNFESGEFELVN